MRKSIRKHFESLVEEHGFSHKSLEWGSVESQYKRFKILSEIADLNSKSILDVGCGFAQLFDYLSENKIYVKYSGMDIVPKMIELARSRWEPINLFWGDIRTIESLPEKYDYAFASGIFSRMESVKDIQKSIKNMFSICEEGIAFNTVSIYSHTFSCYKGKTNLGYIFYRHENQFWANPAELLNFCISMTPYVVLRHDYLPNDLTIYMYKGQQM